MVTWSSSRQTVPLPHWVREQWRHLGNLLFRKFFLGTTFQLTSSRYTGNFAFICTEICPTWPGSRSYPDQSIQRQGLETLFSLFICFIREMESPRAWNPDNSLVDYFLAPNSTVAFVQSIDRTVLIDVFTRPRLKHKIEINQKSDSRENCWGNLPCRMACWWRWWDARGDIP